MPDGSRSTFDGAPGGRSRRVVVVGGGGTVVVDAAVVGGGGAVVVDADTTVVVGTSSTTVGSGSTLVVVVACAPSVVVVGSWSEVVVVAAVDAPAPAATDVVVSTVEPRTDSGAVVGCPAPEQAAATRANANAAVTRPTTAIVNSPSRRGKKSRPV